MTFRIAFRALVRTPGFSSVAILTLALGIAATTAMFSVVNGVLFKPLRFPNPGRLYVADTHISAPDTGREGVFPVNARHFSDWRTRCQSCESVALVGALGLTLTGSGTPERLPAIEVSYNFFRTLGVSPQIGRDFASAEEGPGGFHVVLLSDTAWRTRFGADPSIVGRSITLNGESHTVLGVMPATLTLPRGTQWGQFFPQPRSPLVFRPVALDFPNARNWSSFNYVAVVRLHPGASARQAETEMTAAIADYGRPFGVSGAAVLTPMADRVTMAARRNLFILGGAVAAVLMLVSLNIGGLLLVRSVGRSKDASIRLALGARRRDLMGTMVAEVVLLVAAGGLLGTALAGAAVRVLVAVAPVDLPRLDELRPDGSMLALSLLSTVPVALLASLAPLWRLTRADLSLPLTAATRSATESRGRLRALDAMMVGQVALSTVVLILGSVFVVSFINAMNASRGFDTAHVVTQPLPLNSPAYQTTDARNRFVERALSAFLGMPGVSAVGMTSQLPLRGETWVDTVLDADHPGDERQAPLVNKRFISPGYLGALGVRIVEGRDINESDRHRPAVALISRKTASLLWPGQSAIGKHVFKTVLPPPPSGTASEKAEVVGVVDDVRSAGLEEEPAPIVYEPYWLIGPGGPAFVFRTEREPAALAPEIRAVIAGLDSELPVAPAVAMQALVAEAASARRFQTVVVTAFSGAALAIAALGLYGLVSFSVARRTREIGLRAALGASHGRILAMMLRQGLRPVAIGAAIGLVAAVASGDVISSQLYGVSAQDPRVLAGVAVILGIVATAACWIPARRATRVDPMIPLRAE